MSLCFPSSHGVSPYLGIFFSSSLHSFPAYVVLISFLHPLLYSYFPLLLCFFLSQSPFSSSSSLFFFLICVAFLPSPYAPLFSNLVNYLMISVFLFFLSFHNVSSSSLSSCFLFLLPFFFHHVFFSLLVSLTSLCYFYFFLLLMSFFSCRFSLFK